MAEDDPLRAQIRKLRAYDADDEEDSTVTIVDQYGRKVRVRADSSAEIRLSAGSVSPPSQRGGSKIILVNVLTLLPPWGRVIVTLAVIGSITYGGHQLGWW
jgi:hypothetical protein